MIYCKDLGSQFFNMSKKTKKDTPNLLDLREGKKIYAKDRWFQF